MKITAITGAMLAALSLAALPAVAASNSLAFQGVTFNTDALDADTLKLEILNATSATGNWAGVNWLKAFEIKDIGNVTAASIFSGPGSFAANVTNGLSANAGCQTGGTNGACFTGAAIALTPAMTWVIDFTGTRPDFRGAAPEGAVPEGCRPGQSDRRPAVAGNSAGPGARNLRDAARRMGLVGVIARRRRAEQGNG
jgi:hypothetical protein